MLSCKKDIEIRFSEVDSLRIVWHGNYVHYFEDAREHFGNMFGLGYLDVFNNGFVTPIVHLDIDYKKYLAYGEKAYIEIEYVDLGSCKNNFQL